MTKHLTGTYTAIQNTFYLYTDSHSCNMCMQLTKDTDFQVSTEKIQLSNIHYRYSLDLPHQGLDLPHQGSTTGQRKNSTPLFSFCVGTVWPEIM